CCRWQARVERPRQEQRHRGPRANRAPRTSVRAERVVGVDARLAQAGKSPKPTCRQSRTKGATPQQPSLPGEYWSPSFQRFTAGGDWGIVYTQGIPLHEPVPPVFASIEKMAI